MYTSGSQSCLITSRPAAPQAKASTRIEAFRKPTLSWQRTTRIQLYAKPCGRGIRCRSSLAAYSACACIYLAEFSWLLSSQTYTPSSVFKYGHPGIEDGARRGAGGAYNGDESEDAGKEHPPTLTSMDNLVFPWKGQGLQKEALALMEDCCQLQNETLGPNHPSTWSSLASLNKGGRGVAVGFLTRCWYSHNDEARTPYLDILALMERRRGAQ